MDSMIGRVGRLFTLVHGGLWRGARRRVARNIKRITEELPARWLSAADSDVDVIHGRISPPFDFLLCSEKARLALEAGYRQERLRAIGDACPQVESLALLAAEQICEHRFDLLGSGLIQLGQSINWLVDFKSGHRFSPQKYYACIRPAPYPNGYEIKLPWELSRCQHFVWLGQAYWFSEDEKYAKEFVAQVEDWIASNPWPWGVNWTSTMDVAIRAVNWLWAYHFFAGSKLLSLEFQQHFFACLWRHGQHIVNNLEKQDDFSNNHYLANLVGLVYLGVLCPFLQEAKYWQEFGLREFWMEVVKQFYPDGSNFEGSTAYHRLSLEMVLSVVALCRLNNIAVPGPVWERLTGALTFVLHYCKPDGTVPLVGDLDNGRLHRLTFWDNPAREWCDHRYLLAIGAVLLDRHDFAQAAGDQWQDALWLFGKKATAMMAVASIRENRLGIDVQSRSFADSGFYILRHQESYLFITARNSRRNGPTVHLHNDITGFEFHSHGQDWLTDSGQFCYTQDAEERNAFRSTAYHNVVQIDNAEINHFRKQFLFKLPQKGQINILRWQSGAEYDALSLEHTGYHRLARAVTVQRHFYYSKIDWFWLYQDRLLGDGAHHIQGHWHFAPGLEVCVNGTNEVTAVNPQTGRQLRITLLLPDDNNGAQPGFQLQSGWYAPSYGRKIARQVLTYTLFQAQLPVRLTFLFHAPPVHEGEAISENIRANAMEVVAALPI
jgi:hypothetical protein